jgi:hypothetical protein
MAVGDRGRAEPLTLWQESKMRDEEMGLQQSSSRAQPQ